MLSSIYIANVIFGVTGGIAWEFINHGWSYSPVSAFMVHDFYTSMDTDSYPAT